MSHAHQRGFTLIEMIAVIGIISVLLGFGIFNFRPFLKATTLAKDTSDLAALIRTARQKSVTVVQHAGQYPSYGVYVSVGGAPILFADCVADDNADGRLTSSDTFGYVAGNCGGNSTVQTLTFGAGVSVTKLSHVPEQAGGWPGGASVMFVRPVPSIYLVRHTGGSQHVLRTGTLTIELTGPDSATSNISINSSGNVQIID